MKQTFKPGETVKVGFLFLKVLAVKKSGSVLESAKGKLFFFAPYHGLKKLENYNPGNYCRYIAGLLSRQELISVVN